MNTSARLEDFQYIRGDPRPFFYNFILNLCPNIHGFVTNTQKNQKFNFKDVFVFKCDPELHRRELISPRGKALERLHALLKDPEVKMILLPIVLVRKLNCKRKGIGRHHNLVLYNKVTKEVERLDVRKYHLDGFSLKLLIKKISADLVDKLLKSINPQVHLVSDLDVPIKFVHKLGYEKSMEAYPQFLMTYLKMRNDYPDLDRIRVLSKTTSCSKAQVLKLWDDYVQYREGIPEKTKCKPGGVVNPETRKCLVPLSKTFQKYLIEKPRPACKENTQYNPLLEKCVSPEKMVDVNVFLNEIIDTDMKKGRKVKLVHIDSNVPIIMGAMNFILSKYPYAKFIRPEEDEVDIRNLQKRHYQISWLYRKEKDTFELKIHEFIWNAWSKAMANPAIRFIINFVLLMSTERGFHANVLIYDKATNEMERFDGLGRDLAKLYHWEEMDEALKKAFAQRTDLFPKPFKYLPPLDFCPKIPVFQSKEVDEIAGDDLTGNCAVWRMWYVHVRMANPTLTRKQLVKLAAKKIADTGSLYKFIKGYQRYILTAVKSQQGL